MKKFQKYISGLFIIISFFGFLRFVDFTFSHDFDHKRKSDLITGIFFVCLLLQSLIYTIIFIYHLILFFKFKDNYSVKVLRIIGTAFLLFIIWILITLFLINEHNIPFWGPDNYGLIFISVSSIFINYLIFSLSIANKIISPLKLYLYYKDFEE